ncbi:MAG: hypothetical protein L0Y50_11085 [Beijerinckiaceae bacterium]|nr:hypothetical protein [Beijerinckiaceae bacterium]
MTGMTFYEIIATALAFAAIAVSVFALRAQRRLQKESNELQRATSELAKKQLELLAREDETHNKARISLDLIKESRNSFRFVLTNIGKVDARNVNLKLLLDNPADSPLIASEVQSKLPAPKLSPGSSLSLIAALHMGSPLAYRAQLTWTNPDGTESADETFASL